MTEGCQCYMCQNKDNLDRLHGYHTGYYEAAKTIVNELNELGIRHESIENESIGGILSRAEFNMNGAGEMLICIEKKLNEQKS